MVLDIGRDKEKDMEHNEIWISAQNAKNSNQFTAMGIAKFGILNAIEDGMKLSKTMFKDLLVLVQRNGKNWFILNGHVVDEDTARQHC